MNTQPSKITAILLPDGWHTVTWNSTTSTYAKTDAGFLFRDEDHGGTLTTGPETSVLALRHATVSPTDDHLDKLTHYIDTADPEGASRTAIIRQLFASNIAKDRLDELIQALTETGRYEVVELATGGRPKTMIRRKVTDQ